ncbi:MAG: sulfotransferase, partial [Actinobacteria bacterium]|nr:sulfotransferase [Actinomycetota bacterium]
APSRSPIGGKPGASDQHHATPSTSARDPSDSVASVVMPNFFVIGAAKSGTTSLYEYLGQHADIFMCPVKEPSFFKPPSGMDRPAVRTREEYLALFEGVRGERAIGEATPAYLTSTAAAGNIRDEVPSARLIAILRNPADRAFSAYAMHYSHGNEPLSFADAVTAELANPDDPKRQYVRYGFYGAQLAPYYERFDAGQIRVCLYDDLQTEPASLLRGLYEHLGVDASFAPDLGTRFNPRRRPPKHPGFNRFVSRAPVRALRGLVPDAWRARAKARARRRSDVPLEFPAATRRMLLDLYRDDIARLERRIDRDLSVWSATG